MEKKGFFKIKSRAGWLMLIGLMIVALLMYFPSIYNGVTAGGTSYQFIWACVVIMAAPIIGLIDTYLEKEEKK